jgi:hypothetical protein
MDKAIIETKFVAVRAGGERIELTVSVGRPYPCKDDPESWACPVAILPDYSHLRDIVGGDSLQALCLGIRMILDLLDGYRQDGGRLLLDEKSEVPLDAYGLVRRNG